MQGQSLENRIHSAPSFTSNYEPLPQHDASAGNQHNSPVHGYQPGIALCQFIFKAVNCRMCRCRVTTLPEYLPSYPQLLPYRLFPYFKTRTGQAQSSDQHTWHVYLSAAYTAQLERMVESTINAEIKCDLQRTTALCPPTPRPLLHLA